MFWCTDRLEGCCCILNDLLDVKFCLGKKELFCIKFIQRQQITCQVRQPFCFEQDNIQIFLIHFRGDRAVCHCLYISFDGSEGRAEVVGYICHDLFLIVIHIFELCSHIVQGSREVSHFVMGGDRDLIVKVSKGILLRCL